MGCCSGKEIKTTGTELTVEQQPHCQLQETTPPPPPTPPKAKKTIINSIFNILYECQFTEHEFKKSTTHSLKFNGTFRSWKQSSEKVSLLSIQGLVSPVDIEQLKQANNKLKQLKQDQKTLSSPIKIDPNLQFRCALKVGEPFPKVTLNFFKEQKDQLLFREGEMTIIRSWNLGEQMVNFERMVDYIDLLEKKRMPTRFRLIGIIRSADDQTDSYQYAIDYNKWKNFQQISLIQDGSENDVSLQLISIFIRGICWILTITRMRTQSKSENQDNILSCCLIDSQGKVLWKRYDHELAFSSDADEVEEELAKCLDQKDMQAKITKPSLPIKTAISKLNYQQLKLLITEIIKQKFGEMTYTRQLIFEISKEVFYQNSTKTGVSLLPPIIQIHSSNKSADLCQNLLNALKEKLGPDFTKQITLVNWDLDILIDKLSKILLENDIKCQVSLEKILRININKQSIVIQNTPWEQGNFLPSYSQTSSIQHFRQWLIKKENILQKLQLEQNKQNISTDQGRMIEICLNFFRQNPGVVFSDSKFGKIPYTERRQIPFEDLPQSTSQGLDFIQRDQGRMLMIYLIDYENDESVKILNQIIAEKEKSNLKLQVVVLGYIRAESWTKLFQAFIDHHKLSDKISAGVIETWFPIEDKINSLSFLGILGRIYGMQLEKKDIMIVDNSDNIVSLSSSRKLIENFSQILSSPASNLSNNVDKKQFESQWLKLKKFLRQSQNLEQQCSELQGFLKDDEDFLQIEHKQMKVWDFQKGESQVLPVKSYTKPTIRIRGTDELKNKSNTLLLESVFKLVPKDDFDIR